MAYWILFSLLVAAPPAAPQQVGSRVILASVKDPDGRPRVDIELDDFVVREAGQDRDILSSRIADYPMVLVLDNSKGAREFEAIRRAARRFIDRIGHRPVAVASASPPRMIAGFDDDRATVLRAVDQLRKSSSGTGLFEAALAAARAVHATGASFSAVILVVADAGGGVPEDILEPIRESGTTVHVVIQQKTSGRPDEQQRQSINALVALVDATRGELLTVFSPDAYQLALDRAARQFAAEVIVEYLVPAGSSVGKDVQFGVRGGTITKWAVSAR